MELAGWLLRFWERNWKLLVLMLLWLGLQAQSACKFSLLRAWSVCLLGRRFPCVSDAHTPIHTIRQGCRQLTCLVVCAILFGYYPSSLCGGWPLVAQCDWFALRFRYSSHQFVDVEYRLCPCRVIPMWTKRSIGHLAHCSIHIARIDTYNGKTSCKHEIFQLGEGE